MHIYLIAVGQKIPQWVEQGYREFARRLPPECVLSLVEIAAARRRKGVPVAGLLEQEGERMLARLPRGARVVALDERGGQWTTPQLARKLRTWLQGGQDVALLAGGADGLAPSCRSRAGEHWSLSPLTLPHALVRIVVAEQIYRAWTILQGHPYHRGD